MSESELDILYPIPTHRALEAIDDVCDAQEDSTDVTLQPGAGPQLLLAKAGHKPEILSLHLRIGFEEPENITCNKADIHITHHFMLMG